MSDLFGQFIAFEAALDRPAIEALLAEAGTEEPSKALRSSLEEASNALRHLDGFLPRRGRILEIGAGIGVLSAFLVHAGYDLVALEPGGQGYELNRQISQAVFSSSDATKIVLDIPAETLRADEHGVFDAIFSINVIEHVDDPGALLRKLDEVLAPDGAMLHSCPNYRVPYEPHFGIPLVPFAPHLTARLVRKETRESGLWRSLNFIDTRVVTTFASDRGFDVEFKEGLLADALDRLVDDPSFAERHAPLVRVTRVVEKLRLNPLIRRIPATAMTPMVFTLRRKNRAT